jgi:nucleotide-binding universal stress UspA family protein
MTLRDLVVHVDNSRTCEARIASAINLAVRHDAHLTGVYVLSPPHIPGYIRSEMSEEILARQAAFMVERAKKHEEAFNDLVRRAGITAEWRAVEGPVVRTLALHGRYADVVVAGQRDPSGEEGSDDPTMPEELVLACGRPVLVVPYVGSYPQIGERIMVAWDASRLATRAVNDALPLLTTAKHVFVIAVNPDGGDDGHGEIPSADICLHLARHGVKAEAQHVFADDLSVGELLLSRVADEAIDLLVIGAYGHARWRELVLGGVTRHMLYHMTVPVLMSH